MDRNSSSRSLRSSSRFDQQRSVVSGSSSGIPQTNHNHHQSPVHAHRQHMSGVPQPPPPPPASTSRSAHKEVPATSTAVTPEETPATRRSKRISAMAQHPYYGSDYPSSGKLLLKLFVSLVGRRGQGFSRKPGKFSPLPVVCCMRCTSLRALSAKKNPPPIAQRQAIECVSRAIAMRLSMLSFGVAWQQIPKTPHDFC